VSLEITFNNISKAIEEPPKLTLFIQNYHYETTHYTDSKGRRKTRRKRVNTYRYSEQYIVNQWQDKSPPVSSIDFLKTILLTRLRTEKNFEFSPQAWARYEGQHA